MRRYPFCEKSMRVPDNRIPTCGRLTSGSDGLTQDGEEVERRGAAKTD